MSQSSSESVSENKSTNVRAKRDRDALPLGLRALREGLGVLSRVTPDGAARVAERVFLSPRRFTRPAVEHELLARARHVLVPSDDGPIATWEWGDAGSANRVDGDATEFCLVVTQRRNVADTALAITGPVATQWMQIAQAFAGPPGEGRQPTKAV